MEMEFGDQGGQAPWAAALSAPSSRAGHTSLCGALSVLPEHHFSCWKLSHGAFSCERKIDIIQEFVCKSTVSNSFHCGIRHRFFSSVHTFKRVEILDKNILMLTHMLKEGHIRAFRGKHAERKRITDCL